MKTITRIDYRVAYNRYFKNQACSASANTYEQAKAMVKHFNEWERNAHIEYIVVTYNDGTTEKVKAFKGHITRT